jgi:hypothetical protein
VNKYKLIEDNNQFKLISNRHEVTTNFSSCSCYDYKMYRLPCRHVMFVRLKSNLQIFDQSMVDKRWINPNSVQVHDSSNSNSGLTNACMLDPNR